MFTKTRSTIRLSSLVALATIGGGIGAGLIRHVATRPGRTGPPAQTAPAAVVERYDSLPLAFEPNVGQTDARVRFLARGIGYTVFLTDTAAVFSLRPPGASHSAGATVRTAAERHRGGVVRLQLTGANSDVHLTGGDALGGVSNYIVGNDPSAWHSNVANYSRVRSHEVYPGIDVEYYGNQRQLEHDFVVAPGADPGRIALRVDGADRLEVGRDGALVIGAGAEQMRIEKPFTYQEIDGARREVASAYTIDGDRSIRFQLAPYDHDRTLVIDPILAYTAYVGGTGLDFGLAIAVDGSGNAYIAGGTSSTDFPTTNGVAQTAFGGGTGVFAGPTFPLDAFVAKLDPTGTSILYATYLGGAGDDLAQSIAIDENGNAYVAGLTNGTNTTTNNFPTTNGAYQTSYGGGLIDGFVTKLNASGQLAYSTYLGGQCHDELNGIALDAFHDAYLVGDTGTNNPADCTQNFPVTTGALKTTPDTPGGDAIVAKLSGDGSTLMYATYLGGTAGQTHNEAGNDIAVDGSGIAYVVGGTSSPDFPTTVGAYQTTFGGGDCGGGDPCNDAFVAKINPAGGGASDLVAATYIGSSDWDAGHRIKIDGAGNAYVSGRAGLNFPTTPGAYQRTHNGFNDVFAAKLNSSLSTLVFSTLYGADGDERDVGLAIDASQNVYVVGETNSFGLPTTADALSSSYNGSGASNFCDTQNTASAAGCDGFIVKFNSTGSGLIYASYLGGPGDDIPQGLAVQGGSAYVVGGTTSTFLATPTSSAPALSGPADAFVWKLTLPTSAGFTDDPARSRVTPIKTVHILELRSRIDAVRIAHGLGAYAYTDPVLTPGSTTIKAVHITDLRTALTQAYTAAGLTPPEFPSNPIITPGSTFVRAGDVNQLRRLVIALEEGLGYAVYDGATYMTTACLQVGSVCDSQGLLIGRDTITNGNELHQPNTIGNSCGDGVSGTFHVNASNDRLRVSTLDGTPFATGKTVRIEAFVWAAGVVNHLDLYYAADASSPSWTYITTIDATGFGPQTMATTYTLPAGSVQAIRARFRSGGSPAPCTGNTSGFDDHDDLVFAVGP